jgi:transcriptional regulator
VLRLRKQGWTLARIGAALGVSRQRVHQIERRARSLLAKRSAQAGPPLPGS